MAKLNKWFGWLNFLKRKREPLPEALLARALSESIAEKADAVQETLQGYHKARDPFAAMLADLYTRDQVASIWKNGHGTRA